MQGIATYIFYERHWSSVSRNMANSLCGEVSLMASAFNVNDPLQRQLVTQDSREFMGLFLYFSPSDTLAETNITSPEHEGYATCLSQQIPTKFHVHYDKKRTLIVTDIQLPDGVLTIEASNKRLANPTTYIFILWVIGVGIFLAFVAILFLRGQVRSVLRLAEVAEKFGRGQDMPKFRPQGAREIRKAGLAFIEMRERIKRLLERRTQTLAGISHDMRTPLTRMRLQLELMDESDAKNELIKDIDEMEAMLNSYLEFTRDITSENSAPINLISFLEEITDSYKNHSGTVNFTAKKNIELTGKEPALRRCIHNLITNGLRYGNNVNIDTSLSENQNNAIITIDDDGPGIPQENREQVFQAFFRVDSSRNQETGGVGLGLAIVRDIIQRHGGEVILSDSPQSGLRVSIILPI